MKFWTKSKNEMSLPVLYVGLPFGVDTQSGDSEFQDLPFSGFTIFPMWFLSSLYSSPSCLGKRKSHGDT